MFDEMEGTTISLGQSCRICFTKSELLSEIKDVESSGTTLEEIFFTLLGNDYLIGDFPKLICTSCIQETEATYEFIQKCKTSYEYIALHLNASQSVAPDEEGDIYLEENELVKTETHFTAIINLDDDMDPQTQYGYSEMDDPLSGQKLEIISNELEADIHSELLSTDDKEPEVGELESFLISSSSDENEGKQEKEKKKAKRKKSKLGSKSGNENYKYSCEICYQSYKWPVSLKEHMRIHTKEKPFKCELCGRDYMWRSCLVYHMATHTGDRPFACHLCDKSFIQRNRLRNHIRTHSSKRYNCKICVKGFSTQSGYTHHKQLFHEGKSDV